MALCLNNNQITSLSQLRILLLGRLMVKNIQEDGAAASVPESMSTVEGALRLWCEGPIYLYRSQELFFEQPKKSSSLIWLEDILYFKVTSLVHNFWRCNVFVCAFSGETYASF